MGGVPGGVRARSTARRRVVSAARPPAVSPWERRVAWLAVGAIVLRLILFLGRGDYVAFDEGWYLLLGRSLMHGDGYSLIGIPHVTLSPLFPALAGLVGTLIGDWVWGGRLVAAVASGLIVFPVWAIAARLAAPRIAFGAAALAAALPSLAPFVAAYWVGADLWVGAEPLWHLFLYAALASWLRAVDEARPSSGGWAGLLLGLGFLARPEAVIAITGLALFATAGAIRARSRRRAWTVVTLLGGFVLVATPYWVHLRTVTGEWRLSGRGVRVADVFRGAASRAGAVSGSTTLIEEALTGDETAYTARLYALDPSGVRMGSDYWGVYPSSADSVRVPPAPAAAAAPALDATTPISPERAAGPAISRAGRYISALTQVVPGLLWPILLIGLVWGGSPASRRRDWILVGVVSATSLLIARFVAVDARTQLFVAPLAMVYVSLGIARLGDWGGRVRQLRAHVVSGVLLTGCFVAMAWVHGTRLILSLTVGSPHHTVGAQNRHVASLLRRRGEDTLGPIASGHPAIALFADRDWRPLPESTLPGIVRYASAAGATTVVLSSYYLPFKGQEFLGARYLIIDLPRAAPLPEAWSLTMTRRDSLVSTALVRPSR